MLKNKLKEPSRSLELISTNEQLQKVEQLTVYANVKIGKHNEIVKNYKVERQQLIQSIWKYLVEEFRQDIEGYKKLVNGLQTWINKLEKQLQEKRQQYKQLDSEISELTKNVTSTEPTINEINRTLRQFGFLNFEIIPSKTVPNHYQLQRENGELAESSLSEGEITFITFLGLTQSK